MPPSPTEKQGFEIAEISREAFLDFVRRHATSEEIGRIGTCLDSDATVEPAGDLLLLGLTGCSEVCAMLCCQITEARENGKQACKLDSVVVHTKLRRRGLATILVTKAFSDLMEDGDYDVSHFYSHAVHPATAKLLSELGFSDPPLVGAPICALEIDDAQREETAAAWKCAHSNAAQPLKLQCALCKGPWKQNKLWCTSRAGS